MRIHTDPLSLDDRFNMGDAARHIMSLEIDAPLFGMKKGDTVIVDMSLKPKNGNLVLAGNDTSYGIYRYENSNGQVKLWPESNNVIGGVIIALFKDMLI